MHRVWWTGDWVSCSDGTVPRSERRIGLRSSVPTRRSCRSCSSRGRAKPTWRVRSSSMNSSERRHRSGHHFRGRPLPASHPVEGDCAGDLDIPDGAVATLTGTGADVVVIGTLALFTLTPLSAVWVLQVVLRLEHAQLRPSSRWRRSGSASQPTCMTSGNQFAREAPDGEWRRRAPVGFCELAVTSLPNSWRHRRRGLVHRHGPVIASGRALCPGSSRRRRSRRPTDTETSYRSRASGLHRRRPPYRCDGDAGGCGGDRDRRRDRRGGDNGRCRTGRGAGSGGRPDRGGQRGARRVRQYPAGCRR